MSKENKKILQAPRGMRDFYGKEYKKRKIFFKTAEKIAEKYGFSGMETPILEYSHIFNKGIGDGTDIVDKEMYSFKTNGGDLLSLRPEGTASLMRAYIEHGMRSLSSPQMLYYSGAFFRHEKPQKGRYRQFYQFGIEILNTTNPIYDAIIIKTGFDILQKFHNNIIVEINSLGTQEERKKYILELQKFYQKYKSEIDEDDQKKISSNPLRILDSKKETTKKINENAPRLEQFLDSKSKEHFTQVKQKLEELNIPYRIETKLVRGLGYYEHTVFEYVKINEKNKKTFALGGGGRYDGLAEMIGGQNAIPSVGLALGVDRILEEMQKPLNENSEKIPLIITNPSLIKNALAFVEKKQNVFFYPIFQKLPKQLSRIEKENYSHVYILGENELVKNNIILKDLKERTQTIEIL